MSIASELQDKINSKAAIKTAIEAKGVTVGNIKLNQYAAKIDEIQQGDIYEPEYKIVLQAMTVEPSIDVKISQNNLIKSLKESGVWVKLDWLSIFQTETENSLINWRYPDLKNPVLKTQGSNYPTHEAFKGYWGNKAGKAYISTEFSPLNNGNKYLLNSASIGFYQRNFVFETGNLSMGIGNTTLVLAPRYNGTGTKAGTHYGSLNNTNQYADGSPAGWLKTIHCVTRLSNTQCVEYVADSGTIVNISSSSIPSGIIDIFRCTGAYYETSQISMAWIGGALTQSDLTAIVNAYENYRHDIGDHNVIILGDSTSAGTGGGIISQQMENDTYSCDDLSVGGERIDDQKNRFNALPSTYLQYMDAVFCMVGLNDINTSNSATCISKYQTMINDIRAKIGLNNKIIGVTMIPCNRKNYQAYIDLNEAIRGNGSTPITGLDSIIDTVATTLNNGTGGLAFIYDSGDGLHENAAGSQLIADLYDAKLIELGLK